MISGTVYTDPYSGYEVLVLSGLGPLVGAAYDPRRAELPTAWASSCSHCQNKRFRDLPLHVKHQIWMMMNSRNGGFVPATKSKILEITVPSSGEPHILRHWTDQHGKHAHISDGTGILVRASQSPGDKIIFETSEKLPDRKIVHRSLKFVFSGKPASSSLIAAVSSPLAERQRTKAKVCGYRNVCDKIDWQSVSQEATSVKQVA